MRGVVGILLTVIVAILPQAAGASGGSGRYLMNRAPTACVLSIARNWQSNGRFDELLLASNFIEVSLNDIYRSFSLIGRKAEGGRLPIHFIAFDLEGNHRLAFWNMNERDLAHKDAWSKIVEASHGEARLIHGGIAHLTYNKEGVFERLELSDRSGLNDQSHLSKLHLRPFVRALSESDLLLPETMAVELFWQEHGIQKMTWSELYLGLDAS